MSKFVSNACRYKLVNNIFVNKGFGTDNFDFVEGFFKKVFELNFLPRV